MVSTVVKVSVALIVLLVHRLLKFYLKSRRADHVHGYRPIFDPYGVPGALFPTTWYHKGFLWSWVQRETAHDGHKYDMNSMLPLFGQSHYLVCTIQALRKVFSNEVSKSNLQRPLQYTTERLWGLSVFSANGSDWRRQHRIVAPAFNPEMYITVLETSGDVFSNMVTSEGWRDCEQIMINDIHRIIFRYTLMMICRSGFGVPIGWTIDQDATEDITLFDRALSTAAETLTVRLILPQWVWSLPFKGLQNINQSWKTLISILDKMATDRQVQTQSGVKAERADLLGRLVSATDEGSRYPLSTQEVTANMLSLLFAGNDTTASTLLSSLTFIGLHPEDQEKIYEEICREFADGDELTLDKVQRCEHLRACAYEAMRLISPVNLVARDIPSDITIQTDRPFPETLHLKKDTRILVDMFSVTHNKHDFPDPESFIPYRWYGVNELEIPMFGAGPRACVGRRFAQNVFMGFLIQLFREWRIETVLGKDETRQMCMKRMLQEATFQRTTLAVTSVSLRLVARHSERL